MEETKLNVFVSYASEDRAVADEIALALRGSGHDVFFDRDALAAGQAFHGAIRRAVEEADIMVFIVSPDSMAPGSYTLTELGHARSRWPNPSDRVLPVEVRPFDWDSVPKYLAAVSMLSPQGDIAAEVEAAVERLAQRLKIARQPTPPVQARGLGPQAIDHLGLDRLASVLAKVLDDSTHAALTSESSRERARERSYALYASLVRVTRSTDEFVDALGAAIAGSSSEPSDAPAGTLREVAARLMSALADLMDDLDRANPQLDIHNSELVDGLLAYRRSRALLISDLEEGALEFAAHPGRGDELLARAKSNQSLIHDCLMKTRRFLKDAFPFADSF